MKMVLSKSHQVKQRFKSMFVPVTNDEAALKQIAMERKQIERKLD